MDEIKENCYKGTRILLGSEKRNLINVLCNRLICKDFKEISIPIIQHSSIFKGKVGEENNNMMYNLTDRGGRDLCLAPEYTAVIESLGDGYFKDKQDCRLFYVQECFRGEKPQLGRFRQFTQFGVEILNPTMDYTDYLIDVSEQLMKDCGVSGYVITRNVIRGLDYYKQGSGFEISVNVNRRDIQLCGGGTYSNGIGFAIGIDRIIDI